MAKERTTVNKIKEILRLAALPGFSRRKIARDTGVSRPVVAEIITKAATNKIKSSDVETLSDEQIENIFYEPNTRNESQRHTDLSSRFQLFSRELSGTSVTLQLLWNEYRLENTKGYSYTQFCFHYQKWREFTDVSAPIEHRPGERMFVDFTGHTFSYFDAFSGEEKQAQVFVAILPNSQMLYVEAAESQKTAHCVRLTENALHFFGGVPAVLVPDNLKPVINKPERYEAQLNKSFELFAEHYALTVLPARVAKPKDKALVENAVQRVYENIFAPLRKQKFFSIDEANNAIRCELEKLLDRPMKRYGLSRRELFDQYEKKSLRTLPASRFEFREYKKGYAGFNYHLFFSEDKNYYSVPWQLAKQPVDVYFSIKTIEIYHKGKRVACHLRSKRFNYYTTDASHMPEKHRAMGGWSAERFINWAAEMGVSVEKMVTGILQSRRHAEQTFRSCMGLLSLAKNQYSREELNKACQRAIRFNNYTYTAVKEILKKKLYEENTQQLTLESIENSNHENIRGAEYYENTGLTA